MAARLDGGWQGVGTSIENVSALSLPPIVTITFRGWGWGGSHVVDASFRGRWIPCRQHV